MKIRPIVFAMMHVLLLCGVEMISAAAQAPDSVRFELATKGGRKVFRVGEPIELEFRFTYSGSDPYHAVQDFSGRRVAFQSPDRFIVEPAQSVTDPFSDYRFETFENPLGRPPSAWKLSATPTVLGRWLNDWVSLRKPGHYRITAESGVVATGSPSFVLVPLEDLLPPNPPPPPPPRFLSLRSNSIEIDIVEPEAGWAERVLADSVAAIGKPQDPNSVLKEPAITIQPVEPNQEPVSVGAATVLRFLGTRDAALAVVRQYPVAGHGIAEIHAGLWASPHRADVIDAILTQMKQPDFPIDRWFEEGIQLAAATRVGPRSSNDPRAGDPNWGISYAAAYPDAVAFIRAAIAPSIEAKSGTARALSELTMYRGEIARSDPSGMAALRRVFADLPPETQMSFFGNPRLFDVARWKEIARSIATSASASRDLALLRFYELDPVTARALIYDRIRNGHYGEEPRELLFLPDPLLPEFDEVLASAYEQRGSGGLLIARYASARVSSRIRKAYEKAPTCGPVLAYFFRVDPAYASKQLVSPVATLDCIGSGFESLLMSAGLEDAAIQALKSPYREQRVDAATLLEYAKSTKAKRALLDAWRRLKGSPASVERSSEEDQYLSTLLKSNGWVLTPKEFDALAATCGTERCKRFVARERNRLEGTVEISVSSGLLPVVFLGPYTIHSFRDLKAKLAQFPKGTQFKIWEAESIWPAEQKVQPLPRLLLNAGMKIAP
jgi:hypothetical protein